MPENTQYYSKIAKGHLWTTLLILLIIICLFAVNFNEIVNRIEWVLIIKSLLLSAIVCTVAGYIFYRLSISPAKEMKKNKERFALFCGLLTGILVLIGFVIIPEMENTQVTLFYRLFLVIPLFVIYVVWRIFYRKKVVK